MNQGSRKLVDTNILVYAEDDKNPEKQKLAINIISSSVNERNLFISIQNLSEFSNVLTSKYNIKGLDINTRITDYKIAFNILFFNIGTIQRANALVDEFGIHFFDALIVASMEESKIDIIITENEKDFKRIPWITVVNPFK
ncbi:MAG: PIN domain-containing protein [Candidatus Micrarchaeota archaeon]